MPTLPRQHGQCASKALARVLTSFLAPDHTSKYHSSHHSISLPLLWDPLPFNAELMLCLLNTSNYLQYPLFDSNGDVRSRSAAFWRHQPYACHPHRSRGSWHHEGGSNRSDDCRGGVGYRRRPQGLSGPRDDKILKCDGGGLKPLNLRYDLLPGDHSPKKTRGRFKRHQQRKYETGYFLDTSTRTAYQSGVSHSSALLVNLDGNVIVWKECYVIGGDITYWVLCRDKVRPREIKTIKRITEISERQLKDCVVKQIYDAVYFELYSLPGSYILDLRLAKHT